MFRFMCHNRKGRSMSSRVSRLWLYAVSALAAALVGYGSSVADNCKKSCKPVKAQGYYDGTRHCAEFEYDNAWVCASNNPQQGYCEVPTSSGPAVANGMENFRFCTSCTLFCLAYTEDLQEAGCTDSGSYDSQVDHYDCDPGGIGGGGLAPLAMIRR
jgi:hypothetical protein